MGTVSSLGKPRTPLTLAEERARAEKYELTEEENEARALRRARQRIRWSTKAIGADRMLTLTYRENQTDRSLASKHLARFIARCRKEWSSFKYVAAPELQERGAWHWHIGVRGFVNYDKLRGFWWQAIGYRIRWSAEGKPILRDTDITPGNVQGQYYKGSGKPQSTWDTDRMAGYMAKYVGKALAAGDSGEKSYSVSRGLRWTVQRYAVRAITFEGVAGAMLSVFSEHGVPTPYLWQHPSRKVVWAAGSSQPPPE